MNLPHTPELTDGVIFLRPLTAEDAVEHLAGEDEEMAKWLSGGRSTLANVEKAILNWQQNWQTGGPRRAFGVFDCATNRLVGFVEVNLARIVEPGHVNVSYGGVPPMAAPRHGRADHKPYGSIFANSNGSPPDRPQNRARERCIAQVC